METRRRESSGLDRPPTTVRGEGTSDARDPIVPPGALEDLEAAIHQAVPSTDPRHGRFRAALLCPDGPIELLQGLHDDAVAVLDGEPGAETRFIDTLASVHATRPAGEARALFDGVTTQRAERAGPPVRRVSLLTAQAAARLLHAAARLAGGDPERMADLIGTRSGYSAASRRLARSIARPGTSSSGGRVHRSASGPWADWAANVGLTTGHCPRSAEGCRPGRRTISSTPTARA